MERVIFVSKTVGNIQYQLYRQKIVYLADYNDRRGRAFKQEVLINAYGITAALTIGQETLSYDTGGLSAQNYEVNGLFHLLTRLDLSSIDEIRKTVWTEHATWFRYGHPFQRKADQQLRRQMRRQVH